MLNKLLSLIRKYDMLQSGDQVVCAVSGGADSMALLWAMYLVKDKLNISLSAAHYNHGLRGTESDRDEAFVRDFCQGYGIELFVGKGCVAAGKKGLEAAARDARYGFLRTLPGKIATAHTADDNAETVLMHLVRGTGLKGLGAIAPVGGRLIRPMLTVTREQVLAFLAQYHIPYVSDSSNDSDAFLRNRLRHHVMPLLKQENPQLAHNLSAMAMDLRQDEAALSALAFCETMDVHQLRSMEPAVRRRTLARFLEESGVKEPEREHVLLAENLVFSDNPSAAADLPGGVQICRSYDSLRVSCMQQPLPVTVLSAPGTVEVPSLGLRVHCLQDQDACREEDRFAVAPVGTVVLRSRQPGDSMRLPGGTKSLKKLFIDRKIPAQTRMHIPVIADDIGVLGVYGIGPNLDRLAETGNGIQIRFERL